MSIDPPVIFLPGMGATAEIFAPQLRQFANITVPDWPTPHRNETLAAYSMRLAALVDPGGACIVGGISFGGILATELCKHVEARACILISAVRSPQLLPNRVRALLHVGRLLPTVVVSAGQAALRVFRPIARRLLPARSFALYRQACDARPEIVTWSIRALAEWTPSPGRPPCPVAQVHGSRDVVFPLACAPEAQVIHGGRHVLTIDRPNELNDFLAPLVRPDV